MQEATKRRVRVLFVDDEQNIRLTLPAILTSRGYEVTVAATVAEALAKIHEQEFEVLLSDLNIGHPADGFTVVSAMRRVHPNCITLILTGYPAFETALEAIRSHVDDYLTKPADLDHLFSVIEDKLNYPHLRRPVVTRKLAVILRENTDQIVDYALQEMKSSQELANLSLTDDQRIKHLRAIIRNIVESLQLGVREPNGSMLESAAVHGRIRKHQSYSIPMLIEDSRCADVAFNKTIQSHLLAIDLSKLLPDLNFIHDVLLQHLKGSISAYLQEPSSKRGAKVSRAI